MKKILFFAGSTRKESFNKKLAKNAQKIADDLGATTSFVDLKDFPMPLYDGDLEEKSGLPEKALEFKKIMIEHDAIFITSPEYNSSFSAVLKNTIDWISRPSQKGEQPLIAFNDKIAAICATSPGALGGLRGLTPLRLLLSNINVTVLPNQYALTGAFKAFDESGNLKEDFKKPLENVVTKLVNSIK